MVYIYITLLDASVESINGYRSLKKELDTNFKKCHMSLKKDMVTVCLNGHKKTVIVKYL